MVLLRGLVAPHFMQESAKWKLPKGETRGLILQFVVEGETAELKQHCEPNMANLLQRF